MKTDCASEWLGIPRRDTGELEGLPRVPGGVRLFTLAVRLFGGNGNDMIVTVRAANRAESFTTAALATADPDNVREVELLRDDEHDLDDRAYGGVMVDEETPVPEGKHCYPDAPRMYLTALYFFSPSDVDSGDAIAVPAFERAQVFTAAALESGTPDIMRMVRLSSWLGPDDSDEVMLLPEKKYGGFYEFREETGK